MLQFSNFYMGKPDGIVHMGNWICGYMSSRIDFAVGMPGNGAFIHRPFRVSLEPGPKVGKPVPAKNDPDGSKSKEVFQVGGKVYYSRRHNNTHFHTVPGDRIRVFGQGLRRGTVSAPDRRIWVVDVTRVDAPAANMGYGINPPTPTSVGLGVKGGLYCTPLGCDRAGSRYMFDEITVQVKKDDVQPIVARGHGSLGAMTALATREDGSLEFVKCPARNEAVHSTWHYDFLALEKDHYATDFDFNPDRSLMALAVYKLYGQSELRLYRLGKKTPEQIDANSFLHLTTLNVPARLVSFSPDGLTVAAMGSTEDDDGNFNADNTLSVIDVEV